MAWRKYTALFVAIQSSYLRWPKVDSNTMSSTLLHWMPINELTSVFHGSVLLLIINFVITLWEQLWIHEAIAEWICRLLWQRYGEIHGQLQERRMKNWGQFEAVSICLFFTLTNCQIVRSRSLTHHINYKFMCLSTYWQWKLANERTRFLQLL